MNFDFDQKTILVAGGGSGIGFAVARAFADARATVLATALTEDECADAAAREPRVRFVPLDVRDQSAVQQLIAGFRSLDGLVNCAGQLQRDGAEFHDAGFADVLNTNLAGTMRLCCACRPLLAKSRGCIVNTASMLSFFGSGSLPAYSASKGGVAQLTKSLAIAWATEGIRVNAVAPGWIDTPMTRAVIEDAKRSRQILDRTPMRRWGQPDDMAGPILFLCSPAAAFVTGAIMPVDGGYSVA